VDEEEVIVAFIRSEAPPDTLATQNELLRFTKDKFNRIRTHGWIDGFFKQHDSQFRPMILILQELM
jgi:hypothetical protein